MYKVNFPGTYLVCSHGLIKYVSQSIFSWNLLMALTGFLIDLNCRCVIKKSIILCCLPWPK